MSAWRVGGLIVNSSGRIAEVLEEVARDPRWKCPGWKILPADTGTGDGYGHSTFLAGYLAGGWRAAPLDWTPVLGGGLEERWVHDPQGRGVTGRSRGTWNRELRPTPQGGAQ